MNPLDSPAGRHFSFRDFIECGKTWRKLRDDGKFPDNLPRQQASWDAIRRLATEILDPVYEHFGRVVITYGFCSRMLAREILRGSEPNISPSRDQHAASELNTKGELICALAGAACDFYTESYEQQMDEVAIWIATHLKFDSLYYYGRGRPVHVSIGAQERRSVVLMGTESESKIRRPRGHATQERGIMLLRNAIY
jgi:hypothetical protein